MAARLLGAKLELIDTRFSSFIPSLQAGRADAAISMLYITRERLQTVLMVPLHRPGPGFSSSGTAHSSRKPPATCATALWPSSQEDSRRAWPQDRSQPSVRMPVNR